MIDWFFLANHPASVRPKRKSKMSSSNLMNCFVCKKNFKSIKELQTHQRANHRKFSETSKGFFICQRCGEHYFTQVNMKSSNSIKMAIGYRNKRFILLLDVPVKFFIVCHTFWVEKPFIRRLNKFSSISLEHFIKHKPLISEEFCFVISLHISISY